MMIEKDTLDLIYTILIILGIYLVRTYVDAKAEHEDRLKKIRQTRRGINGQ